jgi:hypothetical protein
MTTFNLTLVQYDNITVDVAKNLPQKDDALNAVKSLLITEIERVLAGHVVLPDGEFKTVLAKTCNDKISKLTDGTTSLTTTADGFVLIDGEPILHANFRIVEVA